MKRRLLLTGAVAGMGAMLASGCGFQPLYSTAGFAGLPGLEIDAGDTRQDYLIEQALDRYLGGGRSPYRLSLRTSSDVQRLGISAAGRASRFSLAVSSRYVLSGASGEAPVTGAVSETVYYDAPTDPYALLAARADAEERAADLIARSLARDITAALQRRDRQGDP
jgi:hypothetical protein